MQERLSKIWQVLSQVGCRLDQDASTRRRLQLTNQHALIIGSIIALYPLLFWYLNQHELAVTTLIFASLYSLIPLLNWKFPKRAVGRLAYLMLSNLGVFVYSLLLGRDSGSYFFFIPFIANPVLILDFREKKTFIFCSALPVILFFALELYFFEQYPPRLFSIEVTHLIFLAIMPFVFISSFLVSIYLYVVNERAEKSLRATIEDLELSRHLIENQKLQLAANSRLSAIGELSGSIAHEINNPLAIIMGYAELFSKILHHSPIDKERLQDICGKINFTVERISKIITGLRKLSREGNDDPFEFVDLRLVIEDALSMFRENFNNAGIDLIAENPTEPYYCWCRSVQIAQVLLNLLQNSRDAVQGQELKWIRLDLRQFDAINEICVTDSGKMIKPEFIDKIGQPFFTTKPPGRGTGLGLSISSKIMAAHAGSIAFDRSHPHTCFRVRIPIARDEGEQGLPAVKATA